MIFDFTVLLCRTMSDRDKLFWTAKKAQEKRRGALAEVDKMA